MNINKLNASVGAPITYTSRKATDQGKTASAIKSDTLTLTDEARAFLDRQKTGKTDKNNEKEQSSSAYAQLEAMRKQMEESNDNKHSSVMDFAKCMKIARRIQNGDRVPLKDMKFLAEKYPELYKNSILLKKNNPEPKKYKSVLDKGDEESDKTDMEAYESSSDSGDSFLTEALDNMGE